MRNLFWEYMLWTHLKFIEAGLQCAHFRWVVSSRERIEVVLLLHLVLALLILLLLQSPSDCRLLSRFCLLEKANLFCWSSLFQSWMLVH